MTPENFVYWLQGFFEITESNHLSEAQVIVIKNHLKLVFDKQTPNVPVYGPISPPPSVVDRLYPWIVNDPNQFKPTVTC